MCLAVKVCRVGWFAIPALSLFIVSSGAGADGRDYSFPVAPGGFSQSKPTLVEWPLLTSFLATFLPFSL